jgi:hypothetical protein
MSGFGELREGGGECITDGGRLVSNSRVSASAFVKIEGVDVDRRRPCMGWPKGGEQGRIAGEIELCPSKWASRGRLITAVMPNKIKEATLLRGQYCPRTIISKVLTALSQPTPSPRGRCSK